MPRVILELAAATLVGSLAVPARAEENLLACQLHSGSVHQRCSVVERELLPALDFEADVTIDYKLSCRGHPIGAVFSSGSGEEHVELGGDAFRSLTLTGRGPFKLLDPDPVRTYRATLVGDCQLLLRPGYPKSRPSLWQLGEWKREASDVAKLVSDALDKLDLVKDIGDVIGWDDARLQAQSQSVDSRLQAILSTFSLDYTELIYRDGERQGQLKDATEMPRSWQRATIRHPDLPWLVAMKAQIHSVKAGRPPVYDPQDEVEARAELGRRLTRARAIIQRGTDWDEIIDQEMKDLIDELARLRDRSNVEEPA